MRGSQVRVLAGSPFLSEFPFLRHLHSDLLARSPSCDLAKMEIEKEISSSGFSPFIYLAGEVDLFTISQYLSEAQAYILRSMRKLALLWLAILFSASVHASPEYQLKNLPGIWEPVENSNQTGLAETFKIEAQSETSVLVYTGACDTFYPRYLAHYHESKDGYLAPYIKQENDAFMQVSLDHNRMLYIRNISGEYSKIRKADVVMYQRRVVKSRYCQD